MSLWSLFCIFLKDFICPSFWLTVACCNVMGFVRILIISTILYGMIDRLSFCWDSNPRPHKKRVRNIRSVAYPLSHSCLTLTIINSPTCGSIFQISLFSDNTLVNWEIYVQNCGAVDELRYISFKILFKFC